MANWHIGEHFHYETARPPNVSHKLYGTACQKELEEADNTTTKAREYIVSCQTSLCVSPHNMACSSGKLMQKGVIMAPFLHV